MCLGKYFFILLLTALVLIVTNVYKSYVFPSAKVLADRFYN